MGDTAGERPARHREPELSGLKALCTMTLTARAARVILRRDSGRAASFARTNADLCEY